MDITSFTLKRPITAVMLCLGLLLLGGLSLFNVPVDLLPDVNFPVITIETAVPGYFPPEVEAIVTKPIEAMVSTMNRVHSVTSTSNEGLSTVQVEFALGTNIDYAAAEARDKVDLIRYTFPRDARNPQIKKYNPSDAPVMVIAAHGASNEARLREFVEEYVESPLRRVPGVGNVEVKGGREREIVVEMDQGRLRAAGLTIQEIAHVLGRSNLNLEVGSIDRGEDRLVARALGEFKDLSQIEDMGVKTTPAGSAITVKDLGRVVDSFAKEANMTRFQGQPRVMLYVQKESGANVIDLSRELGKELLLLRERIGSRFKLDVIYDQADFIHAAIERLRNEALLGAVMAMGIIFLFLTNFGSLLAIGIAIPVSIIATFTLMYLFGVTLNIVSLSGFTLGVGMLVDNSIVVLENIFRKREKLDSVQSVISGTAEVRKAITVSTLAHIAVFAPVFFLQKKIRMLYGGLFFTVSFSLMASLMVALTILPLVASKIRLPYRGKRKRAERRYGWYRRLLVMSLRKRWAVIGVSLALFTGSILLIPRVGFEPMARLDRGEFSIVMRTPPGTSLKAADEVAKTAEAILLREPEVKDVSTDVRDETVRMRVRLVPEEKRKKNTHEIVESLRPRLGSVPGAQVHFDIDTGSLSSGKVTLEINGYDQKKLMELASQVRQILNGMTGITDVVIHQGNPKPEIEIRVLHDKAGMQGVEASGIAEAVRSSITGPISTEYVDKGKEVSLRVRLQNEDIRDASLLKKIMVPARSEKGSRTLLPLAEVTEMRVVEGMAEIHRKDRHRMVGITAQIGKEDLGRSAQRIERRLSDFRFPEGYSYSFGENYKEMKESQKEMIFSFSLAVILVYMILACLFESFLYPLTIMLTVPMAIIGSVMVLFATGTSINIPVYIGAITLAGIVVNNAIVLVDYIKLLKTRGAGRWRAIIRGGESRLRPIMMTSVTTLLALFPMALDRGQGSNLWSPLAVTIIGGLVTSTILTPILLPVLASFVEDI